MAKEREGGSKAPLILGAAALATLGTAYFGADKVGGFVNPEPSPPQHVTAHRAPITLAIAIDNTKSGIRKKLPGVVSATGDFLRTGGVLQDGDGVALCTFSEHAACSDFELPEQREALQQAVGAVTLDPRKASDMQTHVAISIGEVVEKVAQKPNPFAAVWTDAKDEGDDLPENVTLRGVPVRIVLPGREFIFDARNVLDGMPEGSDVKAVVAESGAQFGAQLAGFTDALTKKAQAEAQAAEDQKFAAEQEKYQAAIAAWKEGAESMRSRIRLILGTIAALFAGAAGFDVWKRNRPKLRGFIVDKREEGNFYSSPVPRRTNDWRFDGQFGLSEAMYLRPTRNGIVLVSRKGESALHDGTQIAAGIFYYEIPPEDL